MNFVMSFLYCVRVQEDQCEVHETAPFRLDQNLHDELSGCDSASGALSIPDAGWLIML